MSNPPDPFEFVKQLWGQMAVPGFGLTADHAGSGGPGLTGLQMPSFDPKELEKRLAELKQVKQWLEMNLNMMGLQINTIEMQLAGMAGLKAASTKAFGDHTAQSGSGSDSSGSASASVQGKTVPGAEWMDPQAWMKFMQDQAAKTQKAMQNGAQAMQQAARTASRPARPATASSATKTTTSASPKRAPRKKKP